MKLNEVLGVLSVEGNPIDVDGLFSRMVGFLSSNLPNSLATVSSTVFRRSIARTPLLTKS